MVKILFFRGQIRNIKLLCKELHADKDNVIKKSFEKWGKDMCSHFCGNFSIVIENKINNTILLFRDYFGTSPLYYSIVNKNKIVFSDKINILFYEENVKKEFNEEMLPIYLLYGYPEIEDTFYKNIKKVVPGHCIIWTNEEKKIIEDYIWFKPSLSCKKNISEEKWDEKIEKTIDNILEDEKEYFDESLLFLSSGVDSSYIFASSNIKNAYGVCYNEKNFDESIEAEKLAKKLKKRYIKKIINRDEYFNNLKNITKNIDQPLYNASLPVIYGLSKWASKNTKLIYSGEGIDEFFGGYYFSDIDLLRATMNLYAGCARLLKINNIKKILRNKNINAINIYQTKINNYIKGYDPLSKILLFNIIFYFEGDTCAYKAYLEDSLGVEIRMPMTDIRLFDVASKIPNKLKITREKIFKKNYKQIFRKAASKRLHNEIAYRKKRGFPTPIKMWLLDEKSKSEIRDKLFGEVSKKYFDQKGLKKFCDKYFAGDNSRWNIIYSIYFFILWYESHFSDT